MNMLPELSEIKKRRMRFELTQKKLAQLADVSQSMIAKIESDQIEPSYPITKRVFEALESLEHKENIKLKQIMRNNVIFAKSNEFLRTAAARMKAKNISEMPVMERGRIIGGISAESILSFISSIKGKRNVSKLRVNEAMGESFPIIKEDMDYQMILMLLRYNTAVLIAKKGKIIGIITKSDLFKKVEK